MGDGATLTAWAGLAFRLAFSMRAVQHFLGKNGNQSYDVGQWGLRQPRGPEERIRGLRPHNPGREFKKEKFFLFLSLATH